MGLEVNKEWIAIKEILILGPLKTIVSLAYNEIKLPLN